MTSAPLNWELCRSFLAVLNEGNLSRAARALGLTQPTLGRHVDEIEAVLGVALFTRSPQGLLPTDAAFELKPYAQAMASAAAAFVRTATGGAAEARGAVRITAPEIIGAELLPGLLSGFREKFPHIDVELALTNVTENLLRREADIAIRMVRPEQVGLVAKRLGEVRFGLYAHRSYLKRNPAPKTMNDLREHTLIGFDKGGAAIKALRDVPSPLSREGFAFRTDSAVAQLALVRAGCGIGRTPNIVADRDTEMIPILKDQYGIVVGLWVVMHEDSRASRRIRLMFDHLAAELASSANPGRKRRAAKAT